MSRRGTEGFFLALLEVRYCALGVCLSLNGSLDMIWGGLLFCSSFNSWKAFLSWCYVPAYPPYGKGHRIFSQDWEPAMGKQELACTMDSVNQTLALTDFQLETYQMALLSLEINQALYTLPDFY